MMIGVFIKEMFVIFLIFQFKFMGRGEIFFAGGVDE